MKTFFTIIPLQRGNDLKGCIYQAVDNSDLQWTHRPVSRS